MKKIDSLKYVLGALVFGAVISACDKFEDDIPPAKMSELKVNDDYFTTVKNVALPIDVLSNDTIGGTAAVQFGQPQHGTIQTGTNGAVFYHPANNYTGPDSFTYQACLGNDCATAMVNIDVRNDTTGACSVKAFDDIRSLAQNAFDSTRVLLNDNLCGELASNTVISIVQPPTHGQALITTFKQMVYVPATNYVGTDEITYKITNSKGTATAKVIYNVTSAPQNCQIIARPDSAIIHRGAFGTMDSVSVKVAVNDYICPNNGPVTVHLLSQPTLSGSQAFVSGTGVATRLIYLTSAGKNQDDKIRYQICQGNYCFDSYLKVKLR